MLSILGGGLKNAPPPQYDDTIIRNDVWIDDEMMVLGGSIIENGCVIGARSLQPPNFPSEPYGIYAGSPARLIRYRFTEKVRAALLELAWREMPMEWIRKNNAMFMEDMCTDEAKALLVIDILKAPASNGKKCMEARPPERSTATTIHTPKALMQYPVPRPHNASQPRCRLSKRK